MTSSNSSSSNSNSSRGNNKRRKEKCACGRCNKMFLVPFDEWWEEEI
jgi:hypothetical protein